MIVENESREKKKKRSTLGEHIPGRRHAKTKLCSQKEPGLSPYPSLYYTHLRKLQSWGKPNLGFLYVEKIT